MIRNPGEELNELLLTVHRENGSDLHLSSGRNPMIRVNGELVPLMNHPVLENEDVVAMLRLLVSEKQVTELLEKNEIDFSYKFEDKLRLRGNAFVQSAGVSIALRTIQDIKTLGELNLPETLANFARQKQGFFLVVGPVGQGKTTTMAALIDLINTERKEHIVTIEDPIEYKFTEKNSIIDQREVGTNTRDFDSALNAVFRQDVNVIMIGEMRSPETMRIAVTAAETGHLVFSTLHTNNASQTIDRIIDSFPSEQQQQIRTQLSGSLLGILSQRLVPSTKGGRIPAYELLVNTNAVSNLIREGRTHEIDTIIETSLSDGMISMNRSLVDLVNRGNITMDDARRYTLDPDGLEKLA